MEKWESTLQRVQYRYQISLKELLQLLLLYAKSYSDITKHTNSHCMNFSLPSVHPSSHVSLIISSFTMSQMAVLTDF